MKVRDNNSGATFGAKILRDKRGNVLNYGVCPSCGRMVSVRINLCPICHTRVRRERG